MTPQEALQDAAQAALAAAATEGADMSKLEELLRANPPKPRTTVKRFAADLKARIERAAVSFAAGGYITPASIDCASGLRHAIGVVDAALSDYDVRDPEDFLRPAESAAPAGTMAAGSSFPEMEHEKFARLRADLNTARTALERIAEYETDWAKGTADNVGALQAIAEGALHLPSEPAPSAPLPRNPTWDEALLEQAQREAARAMLAERHAR